MCAMLTITLAFCSCEDPIKQNEYHIKELKVYTETISPLDVSDSSYLTIFDLQLNKRVRPGIKLDCYFTILTKNGLKFKGSVPLYTDDKGNPLKISARELFLKRWSSASEYQKIQQVTKVNLKSIKIFLTNYTDKKETIIDQYFNENY